MAGRKNKHSPWYTPDANEIWSTRQYTKASQQRIADELRVSRRTYEAWEHGRNQMPASAWRLFTMLAQSIRDAVAREESESPVVKRVLRKQAERVAGKQPAMQEPPL